MSKSEIVSYSGNGKPFLYALNEKSDAEKARKILLLLQQKGFSICEGKQSFSNSEAEKINKAAVAIVFISPAFVSSDEMNSLLNYISKENKPILSIYLEPTELSPEMRLQINSIQALTRSNFSNEADFEKKLLSSEILHNLERTKAQTDAQRKKAFIGVFSALLALAAAFFVLDPLQLRAPVILPTEEPIILSTPTITPVPTLDPAESEYWMRKYGLNLKTEQSFELVTSIMMVGDTPSNSPMDSISISDEGECVLNGKLVERGKIDSISDLNAFPNLRSVTLACQNISDITPLTELKTLTNINLSANKISSLKGINQLPHITSLDFRNNPLRTLDGIQGLNYLQSLNIDNTNVFDLSALYEVNVNNSLSPSFLFSKIPANDYSVLEKFGSFGTLAFSDTHYSYFLPYIENKKVTALRAANAGITSFETIMRLQDTQRLELSSNKITSLEGLENFSHLTTLRIENNEQLDSIEGISEKLPSLTEFSVSGCKRIESLSPLLSAKYLKRLSLSPSMKPLYENLETNTNWNVSYEPAVEDDELYNALRDFLGVYHVSTSAVADIRKLAIFGNRALDTEKDSYWAGENTCLLNGENIRRGTIHSLDDMTMFSNLTDLSILCQGQLDFSPLNDLPNLKTLTVSEELADAAFEALEGADIEIRVDEPLVSDGGLQIAIQTALDKSAPTNTDLDLITELHLFGNHLFDPENDVYEAEEGRVRLNGESISRGAVSTLEELSRLKNLESLTLIFQNVDSLQPLLSVPSLKKLAISEDMAEMAEEIELDAAFDITILPISIQPIHLVDGSLEEKLKEMLNISDLMYSDLEQITKINIAGDQIIMDEDARVEMVDDRCEIEGETIETGNITDISDIVYMPNLESLSLVCQNISEIPDLSKMEHLHEVRLSNNPLTSIDGVRNAPALEELDIIGTNVDDITPIGQMGSPDNAKSLHLDEIPCQDFSVLETITEFDSLSVNGLDSSQILPKLRGKKINSLQLARSGIRDISSLSEIRIDDYLNICENEFTSLAGIEKNSGIREINLKNNSQLEDCNALLSVDNLALITISTDMVNRLQQIIEEADFDIMIENPFNDGSLNYAYEQMTGNWDANLKDLNEITELGLASNRMFDPKNDYVISIENSCSLNEEELEPDSIWNYEGLKILKNLENLRIMCQKNHDLHGLLELTSLKELHLSPDLQEAAEEIRDQATFEIIIEQPLISDPGLMKAAQMVLGTKMVYESDLAKITDLHLFGTELFNPQAAIFSNIDGVGALNGYKVSRGNLKDLQEITKFSQLTHLSLLNQKVTDLTPLLNVPTLQKLTVSSDLTAAVKKISASANFEIEIDPYIAEAAVFTDASFEALLKKYLGVDMITESDLSDISELHLFGDIPVDPNQQNIWSDNRSCWIDNKQISRGTIKDISDISRLTNLKRLTLGCNAFTTLLPIGSLEKLEYLNLVGMNSDSLNGLERLSQLRNLLLNGSSLVDISAFQKMSFPDEDDGIEMHLEQTKVSDYSPLGNIPVFSFLGISEVDINTIIPILQNSKLNGLMIVNPNPAITDLSALKGLDIHQHINLNGVGLTSLDGIEEFPDISSLYINNNPSLKDFSALMNLSGLDEVVITKNMQSAMSASIGEPPFQVRIENK